MPDSANSNESASFRQVLTQALKQGMAGFDLTRLKEDYGVSDEVADPAVRAVFMSQCMRASKDGRVTDDEQSILSKFANRLQLSPSDQEKYLDAAKNRVFQDELFEALDDGVISDDEAESLHELRKTLGLPTMDRDQYGPPKRRGAGRQRRKKQKRSSRKNRKNRRQRSWSESRSPALTATVVSVGGGLVFVPIWVITEGWSWIPVVIAPVFGIFVFLISFFVTRCKSCGASWAVIGTGYSEERAGWLFSNTYNEYVCNRCGNQTWRKQKEYSGGE